MADDRALLYRAHKVDQGILVVRFELPFNIWWCVPGPYGSELHLNNTCLALTYLPAPPPNNLVSSLPPLPPFSLSFAGREHHVQNTPRHFAPVSDHCKAHIGQGVRYNAEKQKVGNYYSTPIWAFRFKCHLCSGRIEIRTDPQVRWRALSASVNLEVPHAHEDARLQNTAYVVTEGARQKNEQWDPAENGQMVIGESARPAMKHAGCDHLPPAASWSEAPHAILASQSSRLSRTSSQTTRSRIMKPRPTRSRLSKRT